MRYYLFYKRSVRTCVNDEKALTELMKNPMSTEAHEIPDVGLAVTTHC